MYLQDGDCGFCMGQGQGLLARIGDFGIGGETLSVIPNFGCTLESLRELKTILRPRRHPRPMKSTCLGEGARPQWFRVS